MSTTDFVMPKLGLTMTEGTISRWGLAPGSRFEAGDIILVVETDKIAYDVEAPAPGILQEVLVCEGSAVPVGTPIGRWDVGDLKVSLDAPASEPLPQEAAAPAVSEPRSVRPTTTSRADGQRVLATPYARRLAREAGIDVRGIDGTGPNGRIKAADVNRAIAAGPHVAPATRLPIPEHSRAAVFTAGVDVDVTALLTLNEQINRDLPTLHAELVHYIVLAASRAFDDPSEPLVIGLALSREDAGRAASVFARDDCRTLRGIVAHVENSATLADPSSLRGTFWIDRALDGISFLSSDPPAGWSAAINIGSIRDEFRPDSQGRPARAYAVNVVLTCRAEEIDAVSAQGLLRRIRALLESPFVLLAS
jgi:pyruvate dehydrogenase E2 component (dihydrolipoamide acetyltransferase)